MVKIDTVGQLVFHTVVRMSQEDVHHHLAEAKRISARGGDYASIGQRLCFDHVQSLQAKGESKDLYFSGRLKAKLKRLKFSEA